jgi:hypothetical protein
MLGEGDSIFFAADLLGRYRVEVEGSSIDGEAVRSVYFVEVVND